MLSIPFIQLDTDFNQYMGSIQSFPMLSETEEVEEAKKWFDFGNVESAHRLVTSHLRLVVKIANGFKGYGLPLMDLIMEGNIGLMQAVRKFNPYLGFRLSTYAVWWIKASIKDYVLKSWSMVKLGTTQAQKKLFFSLRRLKKKIADTLNKPSSDNGDIELIARECSVPVQAVINMDKRLRMRDVSLNESVVDKDGGTISTLQDNIASSGLNQEESYVLFEQKKAQASLLNAALGTLTDRHRDIFIKRKITSNPPSLETLGRFYGISPERVRQITNQAIIKVKDFIEKNRAEFGC